LIGISTASPQSPAAFSPVFTSDAAYTMAATTRFSANGSSESLNRLGSFTMHRELVSYLRAHAYSLVKLARKSSDGALALELEQLAVELFKRAADLERQSL
jgi:hypothetical protein